jgi:phosphatidylglycerol:prolipoprotein diacylglycerol transferase
MRLLTSTIEFPNLFGDGIYFTADRIAFTLFGWDVYWYGIIITAAVVLGILYGIKQAPKVGLLPDNVFEIAFWGVLAGVVGARTYYVLFSSLGMSFTDAVTGIRGGGLAIYGGIIGAVTGGYIACRIKKVRFAPLADLVGPGFFIGQAIGRWGNFFNQEAFGAATAGDLPWGMTGDIIRMDSAVQATARELQGAGYALVHPCFLYESLWCAVGFVALHFYMKKLKTFDGEIFLMYIFWYGSGRAWIEGLRADSLMLGSLKISQIIAILSAVTALALFIFFKNKFKNQEDYVLFKDTADSSRAVEEYEYKVKLEKEKNIAKRKIAYLQRELNDPFAAGIIDDDEEDDEDDEDDE